MNEEQLVVVIDKLKQKVNDERQLAASYNRQTAFVEAAAAQTVSRYMERISELEIAAERYANDAPKAREYDEVSRYLDDNEVPKGKDHNPLSLLERIYQLAWTGDKQ